MAGPDARPPPRHDHHANPFGLDRKVIAMPSLRDEVYASIPPGELPAARAAARETVDHVSSVIARTAEAFISKGAGPDRALSVATDAILRRLAGERPALFARYVRALVLVDDIDGPGDLGDCLAAVPSGSDAARSRQTRRGHLRSLN